MQTAITKTYHRFILYKNKLGYRSSLHICVRHDTELCYIC